MTSFTDGASLICSPSSKSASTRTPARSWRAFSCRFGCRCSFSTKRVFGLRAGGNQQPRRDSGCGSRPQRRCDRPTPALDLILHFGSQVGVPQQHVGVRRTVDRRVHAVAKRCAETTERVIRPRRSIIQIHDHRAYEGGATAALGANIRTRTANSELLPPEISGHITDLRARSGVSSSSTEVIKEKWPVASRPDGMGVH